MLLYKLVSVFQHFLVSILLMKISIVRWKWKRMATFGEILHNSDELASNKTPMMARENTSCCLIAAAAVY